MNAHDESWLNSTCDICGKKFHRKPNHIKRSRRCFCSRKCHFEAKKEYMKGSGNHQYGLRGNKNASWKSDEHDNGLGYIVERHLDHPFCDASGFVMQHRIVAEKYLLDENNSVEINGKRFLKPEYVVHHINFNRMDNRVENLVVMSGSEHRALHNKLNARGRDEYGRFVKDDFRLIRIKRVTESAIIPERKSIGAAGYDLSANIEKEVVIEPHGAALIKSGIAFSIPREYFGAIYARSGLAIKEGLRPSTCVSVIDSDYRGEVMIPLYNDSDRIRVVRPKDRIAQIVFQKVVSFDFEIVDELDETDRGDGGFGSTGRQ